MVMVSSILRSAFNNPAATTMDRHLPMINSLNLAISGYLTGIGQRRKKLALMKWFKTIPELTGLTSKVARDIVYRYHFEPVNPSDKSRNKILRANRFAQEIQLSKVMLSQAVDMLVTGEAFGWMGKIPEDKLKETLKSLVSSEGIEVKEKYRLFEELLKEVKQTEGFADTTGIDEDLLRPRKYRYVPSTTIEIIHDQFDIIEYSHVVNTKRVIFKPKEIVHFTLMDLDGRINGFTPVESILVQLELLRQMWQNNLSIHMNGGHPDKIISFENVNPNTPAFKRIEEQIRKYKLAENKHGMMLFTGKVSVQDLVQLDEMQFLKLGLYITGMIAMQWNIPRSSIPFIVGEANTKDDTGGNSEKGYWETVRFAQNIFADTMNSQLWLPYFGVKLIFDNAFINYNIQEQAAITSKFNNVLTMDTILSKAQKQLSMEKRLELLGITEEDLEDMQIPMMNPDGTSAFGIGTQDQMSMTDLTDSDDKKNIKRKKKQEQDNLTQQSGEPSGIIKK